MNQHTIQTSQTLSGIGIHSGLTTTLTFKPAAENTGIIFIRTDKNNAKIPVHPSYLKKANRATIFEKNNITIQTPEHLLAACAGLNIHNLIIECNNSEIPILDGSSTPFVNCLLKASPVAQKAPIKPIVITQTIQTTIGHTAIIVSPADTTTFTYFMSYPKSFIGTQTKTIQLTKRTFINDIAPARTYGFYEEIKPLLEKNLIKGGSLENAIIIKNSEYMNPLRFDDELIRHKILDLIGDCWILGRPIQGHITAILSGHETTRHFVQKIESLAL